MIPTDLSKIPTKELSPQSPWTGVIGSGFGMILFLWIALQWGMQGWWGSTYNRDYFLWAIVALTFLAMGLIDRWVKRHQPRKTVQPPYHKSAYAIFKSAFFRYVALVAALTFARYIYFSHPLYRGDFYQPFRDICPTLYNTFVIFGFPYLVITLRWKPDYRAEFKDSGLHLLLWARTAFRNILEGRRRRRFPAIKNRRSKIVFLGLLVEFFFLPLMTVFLHNQFNDFSRAVTDVYFHVVRPNFDQAVYPICYHGIYLLDVLLAVGGYAFPMRWLENKIESVDPSFLGWGVALICYPPMDLLSGAYIPYGPTQGNWLDQWPTLLFISKILILLFSGLYTTATLMFGTRFSNLTNRGILTRGVYGWVRHPAYAAKNIAWWFEKLNMMSNPYNGISLAAWNLIYALRALTEERHLSKDPIYREYCKRVRYRFIPGLF